MYRLLALLTAAALLIAPALAQAQELALKRVMLSSGGLGYFELEAEVQGDTTLKLTVPLDQVDDVLKSLVVYDDKSGVGGLSLPGREPLAQTFKDLPLDQAALQRPELLLQSLVGAQVAVGGGRALNGRIVSVRGEATTLPDGRGTIQRTRVTLMTDAGLQQFILEDAESVAFVDPVLRERVAQALAAIQSNRVKDARTLDLSTRGQGCRTVRVAYIVESPVWKASYRLTLAGDPAAQRAGLQGWATVENLSGRDWTDVELTLVSGRPVAFRQALYNAYYVERPNVPVEVAGRLLPNVDRGGVAAAALPAPAPPPLAPPPGQCSQERDRAAATLGHAAREPTLKLAEAADQVEATDAATQVTLKFPRPVTVANGGTLSIPVIDRQIPTQRIALFQHDSAQRNPLAAVRLSNDGDTGLPPGILTIYERDRAGAVTYVGDARLSAFPVGETRMLAYALDEKIVIEREMASAERIASGTIVGGVLRYATLVRQITTFRVRGPAKEPRTLIATQPRHAGWRLARPDSTGVEINEGAYRVPFQLTGGAATQTFEIVQERTVHQEFRLLDADRNQIAFFARNAEFDPKVRDALQRVTQLQGAVSEAQDRIKQIEAERAGIVQEQGRLRENLSRVPAGSDLHKRYLATLDRQETELEQIGKRRVEAEKVVETA